VSTLMSSEGGVVMLTKNPQREPAEKELRAPSEPLPGCDDYTSEQWAEIERTLRHLQSDEARFEKSCARLRRIARVYRRCMINKSSRQAKKNKYTQEWAKIANLSKVLIESLALVDTYELDEPEQPPCDRFEQEKEALLLLQFLARFRLAKLRIDDRFPKAGLRVRFQFDVLKVWTDLGGELKISRHPVSGKIGGPLARYFSAVTQPVHGGSLENLPDVIERQKTMISTLARGTNQRLLNDDDWMMVDDDIWREVVRKITVDALGNVLEDPDVREAALEYTRHRECRRRTGR
jgi:hypothetical protein